MYWETLHRKLKCEVGGRVVVQLGAAIDIPLPSSIPFSSSLPSSIPSSSLPFPSPFPFPFPLPSFLQIYDAGEYFTMSPHGDSWKVVVSHKDGIGTDDPNWYVGATNECSWQQELNS